MPAYLFSVFCCLSAPVALHQPIRRQRQMCFRDSSFLSLPLSGDDREAPPLLAWLIFLVLICLLYTSDAAVE